MSLKKRERKLPREKDKKKPPKKLLSRLPRTHLRLELWPLLEKLHQASMSMNLRQTSQITSNNKLLKVKVKPNSSALLEVWMT